MPVTTSNGNSLVVVGDATVDNIKIDGNTVSATNANGNIIVQTNGTGALQRDSGGNSRGQYAIDLQRSRSNVVQVASGNYSVIGGGQNNQANSIYSTVGGGRSNTASDSNSTVGGGRSNTASGYASTVGGGRYNNATNFYSIVAGGQNNTASGSNSTVGGGRVNIASGSSSFVGAGYRNVASDTYSAVGGGQGHTASGYSSTVGGGRLNIASGDFSFVGGGRGNTASGYYSTVSGGKDSTASLYGEEARSSGKFNTAGDAQIRRFLLRSKIINDSFTTLFLNNSNSEIQIPDSTSWFYNIKLIVRRRDEIETAAFELKGAMESSDIANLILGESKTVIYEDDINYDCDVSIVDDIKFRIRVKGPVGSSGVYAVAYVELIQVSVPSSVPAYS